LEKIPGLEMCIQNSIDLQPPPPQQPTGEQGEAPVTDETGQPPMGPQIGEGTM
jgi:hypothetical protein